MRLAFYSILCSFALLLGSCGSSIDEIEGDTVRVTVSAGSAARSNTIVSFDLPTDATGDPAGLGELANAVHSDDDAAGRGRRDHARRGGADEPLALVDERGHEVALQRDPDGRYWFVVDSLRADEVRTYRLRSAQGSGLRSAAASVMDGTVRLDAEGAHVLSYHFETTAPPLADVDSIYRRGGYIHPVLTPSGTLVTDDYPPNHPHHHGIWAAWTQTRFKGRTPDFWNMGGGTGTVEPIGLDTVWSGPVHAGFRARNRYVDLTGEEEETVLLETWETQLYAPPDAPYRIFDVRILQVCAGDSALHLPEYRYGGVGFRGHRQWDGADNTVFLTSEGRTRADGHATTARWCHVGGRVDGRWVGVAILGHPENFRAPQPMRIHPDEPFFNFAPSQSGDWSIEPGTRYEARYRYVVYDGEPNPELIDRLWNDYAHPPVITVETD